ncbi:MAG: 23S rRNA (guanosine(2251)-2'-O)-methyltransferase RlmB [Bacillota bacterium]
MNQFKKTGKIKGIKPKANRTKENEMQTDEPVESIEGKNAVLEALRASRQINKIFMADTLVGDKTIGEIISLAKAGKIPVQRVDKTKINNTAVSKHHQGIIAMAAAKEYVDLEDILENVSMADMPILVMVDGLEDPHNLGAIIRTCDAVGAAGVIIPNRRNVGLTYIVSKVSAGAIEHIPVARVSNLTQTIVTLKDKGFWVIGCEASGDKFIYEADLRIPLVLVIGGEGKGIGRLVKDNCDILVKLPMMGRINSLNASAAAAVCLYEALRQRNFS